MKMLHGLYFLPQAVLRLLPRRRVAPSHHTTPRRRIAVKPAAELHAVWCELVKTYFPDRTDLTDFVVSWSTRAQRRTLASCNFRQRRVVVARELRAHEHQRWWPPLLYHELCHAVLGDTVGRRNGKRAWHGAEFRALERRHPEVPSLNSWIQSGGWAQAIRSERARNAWSRRRGERGFTLTEVLVAVLLLATSLVILLGLQSSSIQSAIRSRNQISAMLYARIVLGALEAGLIAPAPNEEREGTLAELFEQFNLVNQIPEQERAILPRFRARFTVRPRDIGEYRDVLTEISFVVSWGPSPSDSLPLVLYQPTL